ncbi:hypothetical protein FRC12_008099 [Ceratobasidium sp. 428]|nr:hypothetical protein FRC12_008099 [Ceratobasidium sp. 428]
MSNRCTVSSDQGALPEDEQSTINLRLNKETYSCLPHLFVIEGYVSSQWLKQIVSRYRVQNLHLDMCLLQYVEGADETSRAENLRADILLDFPNAVCMISDEDTTSEWLGRQMFDWHSYQSIAPDGTAILRI